MAVNRRLSKDSRKTYTPIFSFFAKYIIHSTYLLVIYLSLFSVECSKLCIDCNQGRCINNNCVCFPGWRGIRCDECFGRISLTPGKEGVIYDGAANYSKGVSCNWLLDSEKSNMRIRLVFNEFATECIWDHLYVHDGDSAFSPLLYAFSGIIWRSKGKPEIKFKLSGRYAFIHFYSDAELTLQGFNISYFVDDCALDCSNGTCINGTCVCSEGWTGQNCDSQVDLCPHFCFSHGNCTSKGCQCFEDYSGDYCSSSKGDLLIERKQVSHPLLTGRALFSLTYDDSGGLWLLGGYTVSDTSLSNNLFRYDINGQSWSTPLEAAVLPWPRYGHSTAFYKGDLYIYGGVHENMICQELWLYNISTHRWSILEPGPRNISGHTVHVVNDTMVVIFGYSPDYGYSNKILEYDFATHNWTIVKTTGSLVYGTSGHTSVYDVERHKIYVHGGYQNQKVDNYKHTDMLYQYDPYTKEWFILRSSGSARYMHSAAMINNLMLIFGGNVHNDARPGKRSECFSSDVMVYHRDCNSWFTVSMPYLNYSLDGLDRFGHIAVSVDNVIYIFGGFHAALKNDLLIIKEGNCTYYKDPTSCESAVSGTRCKWTGGECTSYKSSFGFCNSMQDECSGYNTCGSCQNNSVLSCQWCSGICANPSSLPSNCSVLQDSSRCIADSSEICSVQHRCNACEEEEECAWQTKTCVLKITNKQEDNNKTEPKKSCTLQPCSEHQTCDTCTGTGCLWCFNLAQCIDTNAYVVSFQFGQCMHWTTQPSLCEANNCSLLATCAECQARPECGWCDDESKTGTGTCLDGGMTGPVRLVNGVQQPKQMDLCPADRWFFNDCPACQCNGHSTCLNGTSICQYCAPPTAGPQCQYCTDGYYGAPLNGASCTPCSCNGKADNCNNVTGDCFCRTRGIVGKNCDRCDESNKYTGNPNNGGTCYYQLNTDFQYTFNLSKPEDIYFTQINFFNTPTMNDKDVEFTMNCSRPALVNVTYKSKSFPEEREFVVGRHCEYIRTKFDHKHHSFSGKENTTFFVYVYNFKTPFMIQISFVQPDKINLLRFFIIFFSCFLSLLLIALGLWKIKHKYDTFRRRQQLIVEMQQMASRPFSAVSLEIDRRLEPVVLDKKDHLDTLLRRRKKLSNKPSAVALEPLSDNKAAVLTLLIQLPSGDLEYTPHGHSGLILGSALVSIASHRKQSLEHIKGDKPKIRKHKNLNLAEANT